jgi:hypothetical protein
MLPILVGNIDLILPCRFILTRNMARPEHRASWTSISSEPPTSFLPSGLRKIFHGSIYFIFSAIKHTKIWPIHDHQIVPSNLPSEIPWPIEICSKFHQRQAIWNCTIVVYAQSQDQRAVFVAFPNLKYSCLWWTVCFL